MLALSAQQLSDEWSRCSGWLEAALERDGTHDLADVLAMVLSDEAQFWPGRESAVITEVLTLPKVKALHVWLAGGNMAELIDEMLPAMENFARLAGCDRFSVAGREGWERVLRKKGFEPAWRVVAKELT
jgi:hypothetical protein